jgi:glycosyltransferase involved in cell wall biosynthesis
MLPTYGWKLMIENDLLECGSTQAKMGERVFVTSKIAVVCPTYNSEAYINRTLESLLSQLELPKEIIFSDDGSQDNTIEIIKHNEERFTQAGIELKVLCNRHEGPGAARNHGIYATELPWVAFLDADDTWKPEKLKNISQAIKKFPEANCFLHWEEYMRADGNVTTLAHGKNYDENYSISKQLYHKNFLSTSAVTCNRSLLMDVGGFDTSLPNGQDYDLWLKMSPKMKIKIINNILGSYLEESTSITARPYYKRFKSEIRIAWRHRGKGNIRLLSWKLLRILISKQWYYTLSNLFQGKAGHCN